MQVTRITTWSDLVALQREWNELADGMPFRTWDWLATWWKHYGNENHSDEEPHRKTSSDRCLNVLAVFNESDSRQTLVGIAPWYLDRSPIKGNVIRWLGSGEVCTDHLSLICRPGDTERVAAAIADALVSDDNEWDRLNLDSVDADDAPITALVAALKNRDCQVSRQDADACWALELPADWEAYLAGISKSHRKQLRQLERRVLESGRVQWHRVQSADELSTAWEVFVDLHQRRRKSLGEPGCFASRAFHDFHREVVGLLLARGELRMSWLELDGTPAAAEYHLADRTATYAYQGGVDPDRLEEESGRLSTILCLKQAIEEGHSRLDFLRGDEPYKAHWRATARPTFNYHVIPNRRLAKLRGRVLSAADTVTDWARQGAQLVSFAKPAARSS